MKIINKLVKKNIFLNKQRSIVTVIGIILSCALITTLLNLVTSFQETMIFESYFNYGYRHITFYDVDIDDVDIIESNNFVESVYLATSNLGIYENSSIEIIGLDEVAKKDLENYLIDGVVPVNENEVVIDCFFASEYDLEIGDYILLNEYTTNDYTGTVGSSYYKVVGTSKYNTYFINMTTDYYVYKYVENIDEATNVHVLYNDPSDYESTTTSILTTLEYDYSYNSEYLKWSGYSTSDETLELIYSMGLIVSIIIVFTSIFCIKNSFSISSLEKTKMFGTLSSVGATKKQIKCIVLKEGFYFSVIGIPFGIILGIIGSFILITLVNLYLDSVYITSTVIFSISFLGIFISIILSSITIYFSAIGSAKKASNLTDIEAIKNTNEIKVKKNKSKAPKIIKKIFGITGVISYKNMKRNKNKFKTTIISLVVSITIFISLSYFVSIGFNAIEQMYLQKTYNIYFGLYDDSYSLDYQYEIANKIISFDEVEDYIIYIRSYNKTDQISLDYNFKNSISNEENTGVILLSISDEKYSKILTEYNIDNSGYEEKAIVIKNTYNYYDEFSVLKEYSILDDNSNSINLYDNDGALIDVLDLQFIENIEFMGSEDFSSSYPIILVSKSYMFEMFFTDNVVEIYIETDNPNTIQLLVEEYAELNSIDLITFNLSESLEILNNAVLLISIFLYGFIVVIILIGLTNIFNTITTNMKLRSKEFATLQSIGMSDNELKSMIRLESILYGVKSLFWGLLFGTALSYLMYCILINNDLENIIGSFSLPFYAIAITVIFVFMIIYMIMKFSLIKIKKQNIIESIKNENI